EKIRSSNIDSSSATGIQHGNLYNRLNELRKKLARENRIPISRVFSNRVIDKICETLPCDKDSLFNIKGISKVKISPYADGIIQIVTIYCKENDIEPKKINDTVGETLALLRSGKTITEIALERKFAETTIEAHLAKAIGNGLIDIEEVMPMAEVQTISGYLTSDTGNVSLTGIKEKVPADVSYGKLRIVLAWLQKKTRN